jgi:hypothetical protein
MQDPSMRAHSNVAARLLMRPRTPTAPRRSPVLAALSAMVVVLFAACSEGIGISTTEPEVGPGTVYALVSANEIALPASLAAEGRTVQLRKGALTIGHDSTFIFSYAQRTAVTNGLPSEGTVTVRGQLRRNGTALVLLQQGDTAFTGTYAATTVSLAVRRAAVTGERFVFVR